MIAIVNYGVGNVQAIANIYKRLNIPATIVSSPGELLDADRLILPGVGAFDWAMHHLNESGLREALEDAVVVQGKPVLGICVGMQMMARKSDEGVQAGLGWIDAEVRKFDDRTFTQKTHLPHMGWNDVVARVEGGLFGEVPKGSRFYFLHSYYFDPRDPGEILAFTDYSCRFASAVRSNNVFGVQFHPEKSHHCGIQLLKSFAELYEC